MSCNPCHYWFPKRFLLEAVVCDVQNYNSELNPVRQSSWSKSETHQNLLLRKKEIRAKFVMTFIGIVG